MNIHFLLEEKKEELLNVDSVILAPYIPRHCITLSDLKEISRDSRMHFPVSFLDTNNDDDCDDVDENKG